jgi:ABC-2 type transport system ATP-binding protein
MGHPLFEARNIVKNYGAYRALDDVSISVSRGSIFGLLGPNGAGKTTLIRIINQITGPDQGSVWFNGAQMKRMHVDQIGYLPEERGLYKKMKFGEQCLYLARLKGLSEKEARRRLRDWFEKFGIQDWWTKKVEELSKGMAQKVQFIVTVIHQPELLIFDEPFTGFDPVNASLIRDEILKLRENGATIIFSTHRMETVEELCDHIALIHQSRKILDGPLADIRQQNRTHVYELDFRGSMPAFANALWAGAEIIEQKQQGDTHSIQLKLLGGNSANDLFRAILPVCEIVRFSEVIPTMNDIFISTVQAQ